MPNLLSRLRRGVDVWRAGLTVDQYIQQVIASGQIGYTSPYVTYSADGKPTERLQASFQAYAQDIYGSHPIIFGLMQRRLSVFSEARFCWRAVKNGNPGDVLPINDGLELLENPWPGATTGTLLARMRQDSDLGGTAYVGLQKGSRGKPDRLRRLRPDWVQIVLSGDPFSELDIDVVGITYAPNGPDNGPLEVFMPGEFAMWAPIPDPLAQFRGMSWITPALREYQADKAATEHRSTFLRNGAVLGPIVKAPPGLSVEQFRRFIEAAESAHAGPTNAGKFLFLAAGSEVSTVAADLRQADIKAITGLSETRMAVAAGVPAVIAGISEGLQGSSLNAGNYNAAKRAWIDGSLRPDWRSVCEALANITPPPDLSKLDLEPGTEAQLWILESDIALLHEDRLDAANVRSTNATTVNTLITAGFEPASVVTAVRDDDFSQLKHTGLTSVQLTPPGQDGSGAGDQTGDQSSTADGGYSDQQDQEGEDAYQSALAELRAARAQTLDAAELLRARRADEEHTGAMIALVPTDDDADRLALVDGEPDDELHLTLFYLGEAGDIPTETQRTIVQAVLSMVDDLNLHAVQGNAFGAALWNPKGDEPAWVLNVGDPQDSADGGLAAVRETVAEALDEAAPDFTMPDQHTPWQPHICLAYGAKTTNAGALAKRVGPVTFDRIRVAFAGRVTDIPLGEAGSASRAQTLEGPAGDESNLLDVVRAAFGTFRRAVDIERADYYNIRWPKNTPFGGRWRSVGQALENWLNHGEGGDRPLKDFTDEHLQAAAEKMGVTHRGGRRGLETALQHRALSDAAAQRRETEATGDSLGRHATPKPGTRREVPGGYIVREAPERNIWRPWYRGDKPPAPQPSWWSVHRGDGTVVGHVHDPSDARDLLGGAAPDLTGEHGLSTDPAVRAVQVENRIREAYRRAPKMPAGGVWLADLRDELGESTNRREIDEALQRMGRERGISLLPNENRKTFNASIDPRGPARREASVTIGPIDYHYLSIEPGYDNGPRPLPTPDVPTGTRLNLGYETYALRTPDGWTVYKPDGSVMGEASTVDEARAIAAAANKARLREVDASFGKTVMDRPGPKMTVRDTGRQLTEQQKLADDFAAGLISKAQVMEALRREPDTARILADYLKGRMSRQDADRMLSARGLGDKPTLKALADAGMREPGPLRERKVVVREFAKGDKFNRNDPNVERGPDGVWRQVDYVDETDDAYNYGQAFLRSLLIASEATELAQRGDREALVNYLRRQNVSALKLTGSGHFGLSFPKRPAPTKTQVLDALVAEVMRVEGPSSVAVAATEKAGKRGPVKLPSRSQLMRRLKTDLERDAVRAGINPTGMSKSALVDALLAAMRAVGVQGDET